MKNIRCLILLSLSLFLAPAFCHGQESKFEDLDIDADGKVTKQEFKDYGKTKMKNSDLLEKFADQVDADKDGIISEEEFDDRRRAFEAANKKMAKGDDKKKKLTKEQLKMIEAATKTHNATVKAISENDWKKAAEGMTKQASDDYAIATVTQGITLTQMELPPQMDVPAINKIKDATMEVLEKYELDDIDITFFLEQRGSKGRSNKDDDGDENGDLTPREKAKARQAEVKARQNKLKADVLAAIDKNDQRWEIVSAMREAQQGSPVQRDIFATEIGDSDASDSEVFLTLSAKEKAGQFALPTVVKMTAEKGNWKYAGIDLKRTSKATQEMLQGLRRQPAPAAPGTDF
ncbi:EF-hand domain-containing protein [Mariniblastus sp.]|nr:EF-hand domain-containing protein [Mariniblastus sp.]